MDRTRRNRLFVPRKTTVFISTILKRNYTRLLLIIPISFSFWFWCESWIKEALVLFPIEIINSIHISWPWNPHSVHCKPPLQICFQNRGMQIYLLNFEPWNLYGPAKQLYPWGSYWGSTLTSLTSTILMEFLFTDNKLSRELNNEKKCQYLFTNAVLLNSEYINKMY